MAQTLEFRVVTMMKGEMVDAIESHRFKHRFASNSDAHRDLINRGLAACADEPGVSAGSVRRVW